MDSAAKKQPKGPYALIVTTCLLSMFVTMGALLNSFGVFMPAMTEGLGVDLTAISMIMTIMSLAMGLMMFVWGTLEAKFPMKILGIISMVVLAICEVIFSVAQSMPIIYVTAAFAGAAISFPCWIFVPNMINRWFKKNSGLFIGLCISFGSIGAVIFSLVDSAMISSMGYPFALQVIAAMTLIVLIPLFLIMKERPSDIGLLRYGETESDLEAEKNNAEEEVVDDSENAGVSFKTAIKSPVFYLLLMFTILIGICGGLLHILPSYALGLPAAAAVPMLGAILSSCTSASGAIGNVVVGWLNDRSYKIAIIALCAFGIVGICGFLFGAAFIPVIIVAAFIMGLYTSCIGVEMPIIVKGVMGLKDYNKIYGPISAITILVCAFGVTIWSLLLTNFGYEVMWIAGLTVTVLGLIVGLIVLKMGQALQIKDTKRRLAEEAKELQES